MNINAMKMLDAIDQYVFLKNTDSVYVYANEPFARIAGLESREAIVGKTDYDLTWKEQAKTLQIRDREILAGKSHIRVEETQTRMNGSSRILVTKTPYRPEKKIIGILGNFFDCDDHLILETKGVFDETTRRLYLEFVPEWLSASEVHVCFYIFHGFSADRIAEKMGKSTSTIRYHIENIKTKMQCNNKGQITEVAMETGIAWKIFTLYHSDGHNQEQQLCL